MPGLNTKTCRSKRTMAERAELPLTICCYCFRVFVPVVERRPDEWKDQFEAGVQTMTALLLDGLPLECGKCRKPEKF